MQHGTASHYITHHLSSHHITLHHVTSRVGPPGEHGPGCWRRRGGPAWRDGRAVAAEASDQRLVSRGTSDVEHFRLGSPQLGDLGAEVVAYSRLNA